jgi:hypothetical protein
MGQTVNAGLVALVLFVITVCFIAFAIIYVSASVFENSGKTQGGFSYDALDAR